MKIIQSGETMLHRRALLTGLASALAAPSIVRAGSLMRLKRPSVIRGGLLAPVMPAEGAVYVSRSKTINVPVGSLWQAPDALYVLGADGWAKIADTGWPV